MEFFSVALEFIKEHDISLKAVLITALVWEIGLMLYIALTHVLKIGFKNVGLFWQVNLILPAFVFGVLDFLFNIFVGLIHFKELPQWHRGEFLLTARIQRHIDGDDHKQYKRALWWAVKLNVFDEHIQL